MARTRHAVRREAPAARQDRRGHRLEKSDAPDRPVAAAPAAPAARAAADLEALEQHREAPFEHFGIGEPGIGHVGLHHVRAVKARAGARAARYGLVVLEAGVAEREIIHRALGRRHHAERAVQRVGHALRGLDVARDDRRRVSRAQHAALRNEDLERLQAAGVEGNVLVDEGPEDVEHRGHRHRGRRIEIVRQLRRGAGEVDRRGSFVLPDRDPHFYEGAVVERQLEAPVLQHAEHPAHRFLGVRLHVIHVRAHHVQAEMLDHPAELLHPFFVGRDLRPQIGDVLPDVAHRVAARAEQRGGLLLAKPALLDQQEIVDQHAFLLEDLRGGRHGARGDASYVCVMPSRSHVKKNFI